MICIRHPLSSRKVEDILFERGIDISHETVRFWWNRFGALFAAEICKQRVHHRSIRSGVGMSMKFSFGSTASDIIFRARLIMRPR